MARKKPRPAPTGKIPPPYVLAMVICDGIHRDPGTGKLFILGCFSAIYAREFPALHPMMGLYIELTNGRGKVPFKVRLIDADEAREPVWEFEDEVDFSDPRMVMQLALPMPNTTFTHPGEYRFQFYACQEFLMERRVVVGQIAQGDEE